MKRLDAHVPGRLTILAALLAGFSAPALAASPDLIISQIYGGGGNAGAVYANDFVELFNRGTLPVSLDGKSIQYTSSAGNSWGSNLTKLPNVTLQPGQYFLIKQASGGTNGVALPTADGTGTINMSASGGTVLLSSQITGVTGANPTEGVIDLLGWGTAATGFEGSPAGGTANGTGLRRTNVCTDTDQNAADFAVGAPSARNTGTPLAPCGGEPANQPIALSCPANLSVALGTPGSAMLTGSDPDSVVNAAIITSTPVAGISLLNFTAATEDGGSASVSLDVSAAAPAGVYPVVVKFSNNETQEKSCTVNVTVQGPFAVTKTIPQIQGSGAKSPFQNTTQTTEGVVTMVVSSGFFLQDATGDNDSATSDGIFVFMSNTPHGLAVGDLARVTGTVTEFTPAGAPSSYTEIKDTIQILKLDTGRSVVATNIDALDQLERVEGMLVNITTPLTVNQNAFLGERGELTLSVGRRETPTNRYPAGSAGALALAAANAVNEITLDDGIFVTPNKAPYIGVDGTVRSGDTVTGLTGVVDFGALGGGGGGYKLQPTEAPQFSRTNPRDVVPVIAPGNLKVASANVLNYFIITTKGLNVLTGQQTAGCKVGSGTTLGNCRGADSLVEYIRQRDKIVNELKSMDADVVGLMEIQNNGDEAANALVDALNTSIGFPTYAVVPAPPSTGTDAIRVAMIYKPASVALAGPALSDDNSINNRPPMAQTFKHPNGAKFSVVVNHLKSKGSCGGGAGNTDSGDGQGCWNLTRVQQATRLANVFLPQVVAAAGDSDVLVIGDLNSHGFEDPINVLTGSGLVNELERFVRPHGMVYSYVFDGTSGYLDHALASASLDTQVAGAMEWHNNADEPTVIDYDIDGKPAGEDLYVNNAFRASDHDPVVVSLNLTPTYLDQTSSFVVTKFAATLNRATGKYNGKVTFKNNTAATINGPFHVTFSGLTAGVTVDGASGSKNGAPYLTAAETSLAAGATATLNVTFTNPAKAAIGYSTIIYSGNF